MKFVSQRKVRDDDERKIFRILVVPDQTLTSYDQRFPGLNTQPSKKHNEPVEKGRREQECVLDFPRLTGGDHRGTLHGILVRPDLDATGEAGQSAAAGNL